VTGPVVLPLPPIASTVPFDEKLKTPGSLAGTIDFLSSRVALQRSDVLDAAAAWPATVQVSVGAPLKGEDAGPASWLEERGLAAVLGRGRKAVRAADWDWCREGVVVSVPPDGALGHAALEDDALEHGHDRL
jgi:hypothetical protein